MHRLVLLAIADNADDTGAEAYPSTATLAAKTGLSERGIRSAVSSLVNLGELKVEYKAGPRGCNRYRVLMQDPADGAGSDPERSARSTRQEAPGTRQDVPGPTRHETPRTRHVVPGTRHETTVNPAPGAPEPSENHQEPSVEPSVARKRATTNRGTRIPADFAATPDMIVWAKENTPLVGTKETAAFVDYWHSVAGAKGVKLDWPATWRNWMRKAQTDAEARQVRANGRASPLVDRNGLKLKPETAQRMADRAKWEAMDAQQLAIEGPT